MSRSQEADRTISISKNEENSATSGDVPDGVPTSIGPDAPAGTALPDASGETAAAGMTAASERPGPAVWIATAGGVGFGPWAPGTWGALEAVILFVLVFSRLGLPLYTALLVVVSLVGVWASGAAESYFGKHDDGRIVIDEVAGQLIALYPLVALHDLPMGRLALPGGVIDGIGIDWLLVVTAFVAFRWFDITKPGPVRWAEERFKGGMGVMADDIVAGVFAGVVVTLPAYVFVVALLRDLLSGLPA